jgi:formiminoglutamase
MLKEYQYLKKSGEAIFKDTEVTKVSELIRDWKGSPIGGIALIGAPLSKPSISHSGASFAPTTIRKALSSCSTYAIDEDINIDLPITDVGDIEMHVTNINESHDRINAMIQTFLQDNPSAFPIILGGDHSISAPSLKGFSSAKGKVGVIQFDAHHDLRNVQDGGPSNGTPFRQLIETGTIKGKHLLQIGIRNFANSKQYSTYAEKEGITVLTMKDVTECNIEEKIESWMDRIKDEVDAVYISVDMDVLDQAFAPGCPAIGPGGMDSATLLSLMSFLGSKKQVTGMDIVEIDPTIDFRDMTSKVAAHVILSFIVGRMNEKSPI